MQRFSSILPLLQIGTDLYQHHGSLKVCGEEITCDYIRILKAIDIKHPLAKFWIRSAKDVWETQCSHRRLVPVLT